MNTFGFSSLSDAGSISFELYDPYGRVVIYGVSRADGTEVLSAGASAYDHRGVRRL